MRQTTLEEKSLTELRSIAQGIGVSFNFSTDKKHLIQEIKQHSVSLIPKPNAELPKVPEPERIRIIPPTKNPTRETITQTLQPFIDRGLKLSFDGDTFHMRMGKKEDTGNVRTSLRVIVRTAEAVMR